MDSHRSWQMWFVTVWAVAVFVVGALAFREYQQDKQQADFDQFVCQLAGDC